MAKKTMKWSIDETTGILTAIHTDDNDKKQAFDLSKLFPNIGELTIVPTNIIAYGTKQKLADYCAAKADMKYTADERQVRMTELFNRLVAGEWNIKGEGRTSKITKATESANKSELKTMLKLGLITKAQYDGAIETK